MPGQLRRRDPSGNGRALTAAAALALCVALAAAHYDSPLGLLNMPNARLGVEGFDLDVHPKHLLKSGEWVDVTWSGVQHPSGTDWVGMFCPGRDVDFTTVAPVKYIMCGSLPHYLSTGGGKMRFRMVNMRSECVFAFFRGGLKHPVLARTTLPVTFANPNEPLQGHLALGPKPDEMIVMWTTKSSQAPEVRWRRSTDPTFTHRAKASTQTYGRQDLCGPPATTVGWMDPGLLHQATMAGLTPGAAYVYSYGDDTWGWSPDTAFTAPPTPAAGRATRLLAFGDMGEGAPDGAEEHNQAAPALNTTRLMLAELDRTDAVLHIGDLSYAVGYGAQWDKFFDQVTPVASRVPYMTCGGNHERDFPDSGSLWSGTDSGGECGVPYERRFGLARAAPWYAFDYGNVHVVILSTEHTFSAGSPQYEMVVRDLASVDRQKTPWVVVAGHRPMYISSTNFDKPDGDQPVAEALRDQLEGVLAKYDVSLALWGHHHSYQRTCPVLNGKCVPLRADGSAAAPVHCIIGMAGMSLSVNIQTPQPEHFEYVNAAEYGYSRITTTATTLTLEFISDIDGEVRDTLVLNKPAAVTAHRGRQGLRAAMDATRVL